MTLPRRKALAVAGLTGATTLLVGSAALVMGFGSALGVTLTSSSAPSEPTVVTEVQYDDTYAVVADPAAPAASDGSAAAGAAQTAGPAQQPAAAEWTSAPAQQSAAPASEYVPAPAAAASAPRTPTPTPPTAAPRVAPEPEAESEAPRASTPTPPKPAGCVGGVLEDDGVWNCQH
jgi:hypothetical protein